MSDFKTAIALGRLNRLVDRLQTRDKRILTPVEWQQNQQAAWDIHRDNVERANWSVVAAVQDIRDLLAEPQHKPLPEEKLSAIEWLPNESLHDYARKIERAHGIGEV